MEMISLLSGIAIGILGVLATIFVSRYYYKRSLSVELSIYRHFYWRISLKGNELFPEIVSKLKLIHEEKIIDEVTFAQLIIANTGDTSISNLLEPLKLAIPKDNNVLEYKIICKEPESLSPSCHIESSKDGVETLIIDPGLMNSGEFFMVQLVAQGNFTNQNLEFTLRGEGMKNKIYVDDLPPEATNPNRFLLDQDDMFNMPFNLLVGISLSVALYKLYQYQPSLFPFPFSTWEPTFSVIMLNILWVVTLIVFAITITLYYPIRILEELFGKKFIIPHKYRRKINRKTIKEWIKKS